MGIYYFLLWIGVIGTFLSQDSRLKRTGFYIIFIYILALFVMVVFRYDVGTDYWNIRIIIIEFILCLN